MYFIQVHVPYGKQQYIKKLNHDITNYPLVVITHYLPGFVAPSVWNSLYASLQKLPTLSEFKTPLKTFFFRQALLLSQT